MPQAKLYEDGQERIIFEVNDNGTTRITKADGQEMRLPTAVLRACVADMIRDQLLARIEGMECEEFLEHRASAIIGEVPKRER